MSVSLPHCIWAGSTSVVQHSFQLLNQAAASFIFCGGVCFKLLLDLQGEFIFPYLLSYRRGVEGSGAWQHLVLMTHDKLQCGKSESSLRQKVVSDECGIMPKQRLFTGRLHPWTSILWAFRDVRQVFIFFLSNSRTLKRDFLLQCEDEVIRLSAISNQQSTKNIEVITQQKQIAERVH